MGVTVINPFVFSNAASTSIASYRSDWIVSNFSSPTSLSITQANLTSGGGAPVSGDIVLLGVAVTFDPKFGSPSITAPSGFTLTNDAGGSGALLYVYRKIATASEGTYTFSVSGAQTMILGAIVVKDVVSYDTTRSASVNAGFASTPSPLVTTANSDFIAYFISAPSRTSDFTVLSPLTDVGSAGSAFYNWMHMAWQTGGPAGTQTSVQATSQSFGDWLTMAVAIK